MNDDSYKSGKIKFSGVEGKGQGRFVSNFSVNYDRKYMARVVAVDNGNKGGQGASVAASPSAFFHSPSWVEPSDLVKKHWEDRYPPNRCRFVK